MVSLSKETTATQAGVGISGPPGRMSPGCVSYQGQIEIPARVWFERVDGEQLPFSLLRVKMVEYRGRPARHELKAGLAGELSTHRTKYRARPTNSSS